MKPPIVAKLVGSLALALAAVMLLPPVVGMIYGEWAALRWFGYAAICSAVVGAGLRFGFRHAKLEIHRREGVAIVGLSWVTVCLLGGLPYWFSGYASFVDALFETTSGFTTTGATIFTDVEILPRSILFWRALTHWLGGMGIIALFIAVLPALGVGGRLMFRSEVPGPITEGVTPKISETAKTLWVIYLGISALEFLLLMAFGMDPFDAICHTFATLATGGFSTMNASLAAWQSHAIHLTVIVFMFAAGVNFNLYVLLIRRRWREVLADSELRFYAASVAVVATIIGLTIIGRHEGWWLTVRHALFQTVTIHTTTGFATDDFNAYPALARLLLVGLMFVGGCNGSTGGGIKVFRFLILFKYAWREMQAWFRPQRVYTIKVNGRAIPPEAIRSTAGFFIVFLIAFMVFSAVMTGLGLDLVTGVTSVAACMGNIGPGLELVGPTETYAFIPDAGKLVLAFCMLLGRLELYTILAFFLPSFWRR